MTDPPDDRGVEALYALGWASVSRAPWRAASTALAVALSAAGQAAMATSAGLLVRGVVTAGASLTGFAVVGCVGALVKLGAGAVAVEGEGRLAGEAADALRSDALRGLLGRGIGEDPRAAETVSVALRGVESHLRAAFFGRARALLQLSAPLVACVWASPRVAMVAVASFAVFAIPMSRLRHTLRRREARLIADVAELELRTSEVVAHVDLFRVHGSGREALELATRASRAASSARRRTERARALLSSGNEVVAAAAITAAVALAERGLVAGLAELALVVPLALLAYRPVRELADARSAAVAGAAALSSLATWLERSPSPPRVARSWPLDELTLDGFCGVTARVAPGTLVVVTGASGAGKTTLLRALLGLTPAHGGLAYGADDLRAAGVGPGCRPFAWVPQDAPVFAGTVGDNLGEAGLASLRSLGLTSLENLMPDDAIGRGGRALSGGERALVSLARALATELPVLLLDEPTASLDAESERRVLDALASLRGRRTAIVVSHRSETRARADAIIEL